MHMSILAVILYSFLFNSPCYLRAMEYEGDNSDSEESAYESHVQTYKYWAMHMQLEQAIREGNLTQVQELIASGICVEMSDPITGTTPLLHAVRCSKKEIALFLISQGAHVFAEDRLGTMLEASVRNLEIFRIIVQAMQRPLTQKELNDALVQAAQYGFIEAVQELLAMGAQPYDPESKTKSALSWAADKGYKDIVRLFIKDLAVIEENKSEMLNCFALLDDVERVEYCINLGVDVTANSNQAMAHAARGNGVRVIRFLLSRNVSANGFVVNGSPLMEAIQGGHKEAIQLLLKAGAHCNFTGLVTEGDPLCAAIDTERLDIIQLLIEAGANLNVKQGRALVAAVRTGNLEVICYLIKRGARIYVEAQTGDRRSQEVIRSEVNNALDTIGASTPEIITLLRESHACDLQPTLLKNALKKAIEEGKFELVTFLLDFGVPLTEEALEESVLKGNLEILKRVIQSKLNDGNALWYMFTKALLWHRPELLEVLLKELGYYWINFFDFKGFDTRLLSNILAHGEINMLARLVVRGLDCSTLDPSLLKSVEVTQPHIVALARIFGSPEFKDFLNQLGNFLQDEEIQLPLDRRFHGGQTILMWAAMVGDAELVQVIVNMYLLESAGIEYINAQDHYGCTALMYALLCRNFDAARILITESGRGLYLKDTYGNTAFDYVVRLKHLGLFNDMLHTLVALPGQGIFRIPSSTLQLAQGLGQWKMVANTLLITSGQVTTAIYQ